MPLHYCQFFHPPSSLIVSRSTPSIASPEAKEGMKRCHGASASVTPWHKSADS